MPPFLADFISDLEEQGFFSLRQVPSLDFPEKGLEQIVGGKSFPLVCGCLLAVSLFQRCPWKSPFPYFLFPQEYFRNPLLVLFHYDRRQLFLVIPER